mmetsp:Transcript_8332/g.25033  ORF Transcript_8332/g.25033 Transcript_8332/m.25033 type:complete len:99 (-) Transcript_8332:1218-1514(-)
MVACLPFNNIRDSTCCIKYSNGTSLPCQIGVNILLVVMRTWIRQSSMAMTSTTKAPLSLMHILRGRPISLLKDKEQPDKEASLKRRSSLELLHSCDST